MAKMKARQLRQRSSATPPTSSFEQEILPLGLVTPGEAFARIRNYLAGRHVGATRDSSLLDQVLLCLFARLYLGHEAGADQNRPSGSRLKRLYDDALRAIQGVVGKNSLPDARLDLDPDALEYVDQILSFLDLSPSGADLVSDAYQCFSGSDTRGQEGQFFTPTTAIRALIDLVDPKRGETIIDPACGAGGFLFATARQLLSQGANPAEIERSVFGVEKDDNLARLARMRVSLLTLRETRASAGDSLAWRPLSRGSFMERKAPGSFDIVLTNPPFGTKIISASDTVRRQFALAYRWVSLSGGSKLGPSTQLQATTPPQVLFVERCISLVRPGGRVGMVVPESILSGKNYQHVVEFILEHASIEAVIGMPEALFKTSGKGGTHTKTALILLTKKQRGASIRRRPVFMAEASWCGHDSRGRSVPKDDTLAILQNYRRWKNTPQGLIPSPLGFEVPCSTIKDGVLAPRAYDPGLSELLESLKPTHLLVPFGDLVREGTISLSTGDEVGMLAYGLGEIPFVRTSDLSNWEIKIDPKRAVSRELFESMKSKQDVRAGDILMVRDGTYLIGTCAIVTKYDEEMLFQSHIYKIRVQTGDLLDPFLLLAILSSSVVQRQIRALCRTQDIIDSLGTRIQEVKLPIPKDRERCREVSQLVRKVIDDRIEARELTRQIVEKIVAPAG